jgi:hypothetical protein
MSIHHSAFNFELSAFSFQLTVVGYWVPDSNQTEDPVFSLLSLPLGFQAGPPLPLSFCAIPLDKTDRIIICNRIDPLICSVP